MPSENSINDHIVDSVDFVVNHGIKHAQSQTTAMLDAVMAETIGMLMHNAVTAQHNGQMVGSAAVTATCAKILSVPLPEPPKPSKEKKPKQVDSKPGAPNPDTDPDEATCGVQDAINLLKKLDTTDNSCQTIQENVGKDLQKIESTLDVNKKTTS